MGSSGEQVYEFAGKHAENIGGIFCAEGQKVRCFLSGLLFHFPRFVLLFTGHLMTLGVGVGLIVVGNEIINIDAQGPLTALVMGRTSERKKKKIVFALNVAGGILIYNALDFFVVLASKLF